MTYLARLCHCSDSFTSRVSRYCRDRHLPHPYPFPHTGAPMPRMKICTLCKNVFAGTSTRCINCERHWQKDRNASRTHYQGSWPTDAKRQVEREPRCENCGATTNLTADHRIPVAKGGTNDPANLQTLCRPCNSRKHAR